VFRRPRRPHVWNGATFVNAAPPIPGEENAIREFINGLIAFGDSIGENWRDRVPRPDQVHLFNTQDRLFDAAEDAGVDRKWIDQMRTEVVEGLSFRRPFGVGIVRHPRGDPRHQNATIFHEIAHFFFSHPSHMERSGVRMELATELLVGVVVKHFCPNLSRRPLAAKYWGLVFAGDQLIGEAAKNSQPPRSAGSLLVRYLKAELTGDDKVQDRIVDLALGPGKAAEFFGSVIANLEGLRRFAWRFGLKDAVRRIDQNQAGGETSRPDQILDRADRGRTDQPVPPLQPDPPTQQPDPSAPGPHPTDGPTARPADPAPGAPPRAPGREEGGNPPPGQPGDENTPVIRARDRRPWRFPQQRERYRRKPYFRHADPPAEGEQPKMAREKDAREAIQAARDEVHYRATQVDDALDVLEEQHDTVDKTLQMVRAEIAERLAAIENAELEPEAASLARQELPTLQEAETVLAGVAGKFDEALEWGAPVSRLATYGFEDLDGPEVEFDDRTKERLNDSATQRVDAYLAKTFPGPKGEKSSAGPAFTPW
jgi:hypothetical protein